MFADHHSYFVSDCPEKLGLAAGQCGCAEHAVPVKRIVKGNGPFPTSARMRGAMFSQKRRG